MTATFDDVILQSQPAFYSGGCEGAGTAGKTWRWVLESPDGQDADWSGVTFVCEILNQNSDTVLLTLTMTADVANRITIGATATQTAALANEDIEKYRWRASAAKGADKVSMWNAEASTFTVFPAGS